MSSHDEHVRSAKFERLQDEVSICMRSVSLAVPSAEALLQAALPLDAASKGMPGGLAADACFGAGLAPSELEDRTGRIVAHPEGGPRESGLPPVVFRPTFRLLGQLIAAVESTFATHPPPTIHPPSAGERLELDDRVEELEMLKDLEY